MGKKHAAKFITAMILCCTFLANVTMAAEKLETFKAVYKSFEYNAFDVNDFVVVGSAGIEGDALRLAPNSAWNEFAWTYNSGRVLLKRPLKLWESTSSSNVTAPDRVVASFNTSFMMDVFILRSNRGGPGEGLAFVVAPDLNVPPNSFGQFLGLTNSETDGMETNKLVAVEFDINKQYFDPDDNHVGININSIRSVKTKYLTPYNISFSSPTPRFYNAWVDYDGLNKIIQVFMAEQDDRSSATPLKPLNPILSTHLDLSNHVSQHSYFGFSGSTGNFSYVNSVWRWNLTVHHFPEDKKHQTRIKIALGVGLGILFLILVCAAWFGYNAHKRRMAFHNSNLQGALQSLPGMPQEFKFRDLKKATNNFDDKNKLGKGGFGVVFKGVLVKENMEIAVKWFSRESTKSQCDFLAELRIINRLRHKHLVKLLGWCHKNGKLLLVYEYMPNGSLDMHLFVGQNRDPLEWNLRYNIISGVASALHYLHNDYEQKVVHRDLKASNIMLDSNFNARLGDFGLARALDNDRTSYLEAEGVLGTMGYIAPECFLTGKATRQPDIYAFGAVLLEVVCGQRPGTKIAGFQFLVDWVWLLHRDGRLLEAVDQRLGDNFVAEEAERVLLMGLACSHPIAGERPNTEEILQILSGTMAAPVVPPFKPSFMWPATSIVDMNSSSVMTSSITTSQFASRSECLSRENTNAGQTDTLL